MKKTIGIIGGKGKMGKYFAEFFERNGYKVLISDKGTKLTNLQLTKEADVVIVSVPIQKTEEVIKDVAPHVKKNGLLMDLTSFKALPMKIMANTKASYLGCHPIFGPTAEIKGQVIILCPGRGKKWFNWLKTLFLQNELIVKEMTGQKHDKLMAYVQTLTHFSDIALVDTLRKSGMSIKELVSCQSPVYRLELDMMGRILNQDPNLYAQIQIQNPLSKKVVEDFVKSCKSLGETIENKDAPANIRFFKNCAQYLGDFCKTAMDESDRLLDYLNLKPEKEVLKKSNAVKKCDIAVLGPQNTYSDMAVQKYSPKSKIGYAVSINEVFDMVRKGQAKEGLVPVENSLTGSVRETLDELYNQNIWIEKIIAQPVHLALVGIKKVPTKKLKTIYSHPQPLLQSRQFVQNSCKNAVCLPVASTTAALEMVKKENREDLAAVASPIAAKAYGLSIISKSIEDDHSNTTYFAVIEKKPKKLSTKKANKTSIAFCFSKDSPGSLYTVLQDFAEAGINLTKIESRPNPKISGEYVFYVDFEGNVTNSNIKKTLNRIRKRVQSLKVLGCYMVD